MLLQHSDTCTFAVQANLQRGWTFFLSPCNGLVHSDGSAFYSEIAPHYKVHCRFPASHSASLITKGFHTPDHNAYLPSTSPQLRCVQLEMTITCSVVVESVFSQPPV